MPNFFREVGVLQQEGKLHSKLVRRLRMLFIISAILLAVTVYNSYIGANPLISLAFMAVGLVLGFYVFSRMGRVQWNEETEVVEAGKMDAIGYGLIGLYIVFEIVGRTILINYFAGGAEAFIFAAVFGVIFGRACGMVLEIHRVYQTTHSV